MTNGNGNGKDTIKNGNGSMKITLGNVLQSIIIILVTVVGYMFVEGKRDLNVDIQELKEDITSISTGVSDIKVNQVIIQYQMEQNQEEHTEIRNSIKQYHE